MTHTENYFRMSNGSWALKRMMRQEESVLRPAEQHISGKPKNSTPTPG